MPALSLIRFLLAAAIAAALPARASTDAATPSAELLQRDLREEIVRVPAKVSDAFGREIEAQLPVTLFRPAGDGPFPLVVISHGRIAEMRARMPRLRFESAARFFVRKGFAVAVPLRIGYGGLAALGDPETTVDCANPRYAVAFAAAALQIQAVAAELAKRPDIDPQRLVLVGQSVGGMASVAAAALHPPGLVATISFAGGHGARSDAPPCGLARLDSLFGRFGQLGAARPSVAPMLWVYAENDRSFASEHAQRWSERFRAAGAPLELDLVPPFADDGHHLFERGNDVWQPRVDAFLARAGFAVPGVLPAPAASNFAALDDVRALPRRDAEALDGYRRFLAAPLPRAFAIGPDGWAASVGDDAMSLALGRCQQDGGQACQLYAVDDRIVWSPK